MDLPQVVEGAKLIQENCFACHKITAKDGANFQDIVGNSYNKKDLYGWIRNGDSVIKSGNKYYTALFDENNKIRMRLFPNLTDEEIDDIIEYIKVEEAFETSIHNGLSFLQMLCIESNYLWHFPESKK